MLNWLVIRSNRNSKEGHIRRFISYKLHVEVVGKNEKIDKRARRKGHDHGLCRVRVRDAAVVGEADEGISEWTVLGETSRSDILT